MSSSLFPGAINRIASSVGTWGSLVKFSHTIFALPFAMSMLLVVSRFQTVSAWQVFWILVALVSARTAAMAYNRLIDRDIDAKNPRTQSRELPAGLVRVGEVRAMLLISGGVFLGSAAALGWHCAVLAPVVLGVLLFYSHTKRFTGYSHIVLGLALALAPGGVWFALTGLWSLVPIPLMAGVLLWVAGFDILYSCQDVEFDRTERLYSVPALLGAETAFLVARVCHAFAILLLLVFGVLAGTGNWYYTGVLVFSAVMLSQHRLISPADLSRIDAAFFTRNGFASILFFLCVTLDVLLA